MRIKVTILKEGKPQNIMIDMQEKDFYLVRGTLQNYYYQIVDIMKELHKQKMIKSIFRPRNKKIQPYLNELSLAKREIKSQINKLNILYK